MIAAKCPDYHLVIIFERSSPIWALFRVLQGIVPERAEGRALFSEIAGIVLAASRLEEGRDHPITPSKAFQEVLTTKSFLRCYY